ncbi:S adenosylmethionine dependent methyltransferase [Favolaschia claudopus]|uniref:S adenosylmethionine dependent methyltransferase n=1 Tax=Favolaschia claudopus TaxID=2862362 RepID=A0AAW0D7U0_9AGAR
MDTPTISPEPATESDPVTLRAPLPGEFGLIISRHGALYASEWDYPAAFEALVARICADFIDNSDPTRERCWIACERDSGAYLGSVMLVCNKDSAEDDGDTAKLRLLIVEPRARGMGVGRLLVRQCVEFARGAGYKRVVLWTQNTLLAARRIYQTGGFELVSTQEHETFGVKLVGEYWELRFSPGKDVD